jgi:signal transduction histidine kinase
MTRRITWFILLIVWAIMIATSLIAYLTTRTIMLRHLDHAMMDQLMTPRIVHYEGKEYHVLGARHAGDITKIREGTGTGEPHAEKISAIWVKSTGGPRRRSMTARVYGLPVEGGEITPMILTYAREGYEFDPLMNKLGAALILGTLAGGVMSAVLARVTAKTSLRPLRSTAEVIGTIDDRSLDRRIETSKLPPELVPMAEKLNSMLERLDTSMKQRRRFLADASHELRTPVAALMTALELGTKRPRDAQTYREILEACLADARHLRRLVEALMAQVKGEAPAEAAAWETIDVRHFVNECAAIVQPLAEVKSIQINATVDQVPPLRTQPTRLRSVLLNLLSNAAEYNRIGGRIEVTAAQNGHWMQFEVRDTGPGISAEHMPHLFEPFFRADEARQASEHLGLGLFLVHSHVRGLGGDVTVESELGKGTTFRIRIPSTTGATAVPAGAEPLRVPRAVKT